MLNVWLFRCLGPLLQPNKESGPILQGPGCLLCGVLTHGSFQGREIISNTLLNAQYKSQYSETFQAFVKALFMVTRDMLNISNLKFQKSIF